MELIDVTLTYVNGEGETTHYTVQVPDHNSVARIISVMDEETEY
jgi:hypothetical protein